MIVSIPDLRRFVSAGRLRNFSKIVREATTSATETTRKVIICAAKLPTPNIAMTEAASAPTPNQSRKNPGVKSSAVAKMAAMINQITQACDIKFRSPAGFGWSRDSAVKPDARVCYDSMLRRGNSDRPGGARGLACGLE